MKEFGDNRLEEAYTHELNGNLREAVAIFEQKLEEFPDSTR